MMGLRAGIKQQARHALQGCWGRARLVLLVLLGLSFCINLLDASVTRLLGYDFMFSSLDIFYYSDNFFFNPLSLLFSAVVTGIRLIILSPLAVGMVDWYRRLSDREQLGPSHIFSVYDGRIWLRAAWLSVCVGIRLLLAGALLFLLPILLVGQSLYFLWSPMLSLAMECAGWMLGVLALVVFAVFANRYAVARLLLGERYGMTTREALRTSVRCTKGHCFRLLLVDLSFLPNLLPLLLVTGGLYASLNMLYDPFSLLPELLMMVLLVTAVVTLFMVQPYWAMTHVMYARYLYELDCHNRVQADAASHPEQGWADERQPEQPVYAQKKPAPAQSGAVWVDLDQPLEIAHPEHPKPAREPQEDGTVHWVDLDE